MISITINGEKQSNENINAQWIAEQINNRLHAGQSMCVIFEIHCGDINVSLAGGDCPPTGNGRPINSFNNKTKQVIQEWKDQGIKEKEINAGMIISFWEYLKKRCY